MIPKHSMRESLQDPELLGHVLVGDPRPPSSTHKNPAAKIDQESHIDLLTDQGI
jgi:hypothetical protein